MAVPLAPPVLQRSLIPFDVLQDAAREARTPSREPDQSFDEPVTPTGTPVLVASRADSEVAVFALTQVNLFKDLPIASLEAMARDAEQVEIPDGETLFLEGDDAECFYVVVDGTLEVLRQKDGREVALRHLGRGEAIGLFGLFSAQLRAASAKAIGDSTVIRLTSEALQSLVERDDALHERLLTFYRERLLEGFMASRLFSEIDSIARARLIGRFANKDLEPKQSLLTPGEVSNAVLVVTHGRLLLEDRPRPGQAPKQYEVTQGQFLVVTCALSGVPSRLRIFAPEFATVAMLSHKDLNDLLKDYPALRAMPTRLPALARQLDATVFCGTTGVPGL